MFAPSETLAGGWGQALPASLLPCQHEGLREGLSPLHLAPAAAPAAGHAVGREDVRLGHCVTGVPEVLRVLPVLVEMKLLCIQSAAKGVTHTCNFHPCSQPPAPQPLRVLQLGSGAGPGVVTVCVGVGGPSPGET